MKQNWNFTLREGLNNLHIPREKICRRVQLGCRWIPCAMRDSVCVGPNVYGIIVGLLLLYCKRGKLNNRFWGN